MMEIKSSVFGVIIFSVKENLIGGEEEFLSKISSNRLKTSSHNMKSSSFQFFLSIEEISFGKSSSLQFMSSVMSSLYEEMFSYF
jgi:hypothetical protein